MANKDLLPFDNGSNPITVATLNTALDAVGTDFYGTSAPSYPRPGLRWNNGTNIKVFKGDSTGWTIVTPDVTADQAAALPLAGGTMSGAIAMATFKLTGVGNAVSAQDATTKAQIDARVLASQIPLNFITATANQPLGIFPSVVITAIYLASDTATSASDGTNHYTFQVTNVTAGNTLCSAAKDTNGAEIAVNTAYSLGVNQNLTIAANAALRLDIVKGGVPVSALTTARLVCTVYYKVTT